MSSRIFAFPWITWYSASKLRSMSTPSFDFGRSITWPTDAFTWYLRPRYLPSVFALAGDSTMTRFLAMVRNAAGSRRLAPEALAGKLRDEAAELEREQRLERVRRGEPRAPDHLVDVPAVRPDAGEHAPLVGGERRLGGGRA